MDKSQKIAYSFRVAVIGEAGVGKTSLIRRLTDNGFNEEEMMTSGPAYFKHFVKIEQEKQKEKYMLMLCIDDLPGQRVYNKTFKQQFVGKADVIILVIDIRDDHESSPQVWKQIEEFWLKDLKKGQTVMIFLSKADLLSQQEQSEKVKNILIIFEELKANVHSQLYCYFGSSKEEGNEGPKVVMNSIISLLTEKIEEKNQGLQQVTLSFSSHPRESMDTFTKEIKQRKSFVSGISRIISGSDKGM